MLIIAGAHDQQEQSRIRRKFRTGELTRLRRGVYVPTNSYQALERWRRFDLYSIATGISRPQNILVGKSAASVLDIPYGAVPDRVELGGIRGQAGAADKFVRYRRISVPHHRPAELLRVRGSTLTVTSVPQTLLDLARWHGIAEGVQAIDHFLHNNMVSRDQLAELLKMMKGSWGLPDAVTALHLAHPSAESPRESALRIKMWEAGLPAPHLQATVWNRQGVLLGRPDFRFPRHAVGVE